MSNKIYVVVDVESNGPVPHLFEMTSFGAVVIDLQARKLGATFYSRLETKGAASGFLELVDATQPVETAAAAMTRFEKWLLAMSPDNIDYVFVSDNPCFDWGFINYYFHSTIGRNPFGFSGRRIGDFWAGLQGNFTDQSGWRKLVRTAHSHHPTEDAVGHGEALLAMLPMSKGPDELPGYVQVKPPGIPTGHCHVGDWMCPKCNVMIWASKPECRKCNSKRP